MPLTQPDGYLAQPPGGQGQPVLVLHPWWGLNDTIKAFCDRLAEAGFLVFAADLYHGKVVDTIPAAEEMAGAIFNNMEPAIGDAVAAARYLDERAAATGGLAVVGFSLGAFFALDLSVRVPDLVQSVVAYYGTGPDDFSAAQASYLGHFAEHDEFEPEENVAGLEAALKRADRPALIHRYPGTGHWFAEPDRPQAYNQQAADLAWNRTLAFLKGQSIPQ